MKTRVISLTNHKGGVGKTTSTFNIGVGLANKGRKVLLIDLDPQASLTMSVGLDPSQYEDKNIVQILLNKRNIKECIFKVKENLYIIPSSITLEDIEDYLARQPYKEMLLKEALDTIKDIFNYVIIDNPPSLSTLTQNGLGASNEVFIPIEAEYLALQGTSQLVNKITDMKRGNKELAITGVFLTKYDQRKNLNKEVKDILENNFKGVIFNTYINTNVALAEAPSHQEDIYTYAPNSTGANDYINLVEEIIRQEKD